MKIFLVVLMFLLPLVWSRSVNANYLSTKLFFMYLIASLAVLALPDTISLKKVPKWIVRLLAAVFIYQVGYYLIDIVQWSALWQVFNGTYPVSQFFSVLASTAHWAEFYQIFKFLSFCALTLFFFSYELRAADFVKKLTWPILGMWLFIICITVYQIIELRFFIGNMKTDAILSTFGNVNMMSEFVILSFPLLFVWVRSTDRVPSWLKIFVLFSLIFILLYCRSRSVWMGLLLLGLFHAWRGLKKAEWAAIIGALGLFLVAHFTTPSVEEINKFTPAYFSERASLYRGSIELLLDRPFGIPIGQFMNEIVPYLIDKPVPANEFAYFDQPHSEFLKWGIQFGWAFLILVLILLAVLVFETIKKFRADTTEERVEPVFFIGSLLVLAPQLTFQFPFENPASILVLSLVLAMFLSSYSQVRTLPTKWFLPITGVFAFVSLFHTFFFWGSIYFESHYSASADMMNIVCRIYPTNFKACFYKNRALFQMKNVQAFRSEFRKDYEKNMFYCDNLRLLPEYVNYSQNKQQTCEALLLYKMIYPKQTHFMPESFNNCNEFSAPFQFESGDQFIREYKKWMQQIK